MNLTKRQAEIIDAALRLIARGGIENLTVKHLADALGITEPAIYRHFSNKSEIIKTMIAGFDEAASTITTDLCGFDAIAEFIRNRIRQVEAQPPLARILFAEELFMGDEEFSAQMLAMMHRHKTALERHFHEAQALGEICPEIPLDTLFRLVFGPVRLLIKQWGMSNCSFDLSAKGEELISTLRQILPATSSKTSFFSANPSGKLDFS